MPLLADASSTSIRGLTPSLGMGHSPRTPLLILQRISSMPVPPGIDRSWAYSGTHYPSTSSAWLLGCALPSPNSFPTCLGLTLPPSIPSWQVFQTLLLQCLRHFLFLPHLKHDPDLDAHVTDPAPRRTPLCPFCLPMCYFLLYPEAYRSDSLHFLYKMKSAAE